MSISIRLVGDAERIVDRLQKLKDIDLTGVNKALAEGVRTSTLQRFQDEVTPEGKRWKSSYRASKSGGKTLTDSSLLRNSISSKVDGSGFAIGTNKVYARRHQFGDKKKLTIRAKSKKGLMFPHNGRWIKRKSVQVQMPARPYLGFSEDDIKEIIATLEDEIAEKLK